MLVTMATPISSHVKDKNSIFTARDEDRKEKSWYFISIYIMNEVLFLGVILDEHLSWKSQIQNVATKVSKSVGIIYK